jgi:hypothetical protein
MGTVRGVRPWLHAGGVARPLNFTSKDFTV